MKNINRFLFVALFVLMFPALKADACWISITAIDDSGSQTLSFTDETIGAGLQNVAILDCVIEKLKFTFKADPEVGAEFGVRAGPSTTTFFIRSGIETFDAMTNPLGYASAGVTLTDRPPTGTATITGLYAGGKINEAKYNGNTVWTNLVGSFSASGSTLTKEAMLGTPDSSILINGTLTSIESNFYFKLSANDSASGSSTFGVTPEPATIALLGLGCLKLLKRRSA